MLIGLVEGADRKNSDLVLQLSRSACEFAGNGDALRGLKALGKYIEEIAGNYDIGVFLNMDHLKDLDFIDQVTETGIPSSIMIDASEEPFEKNVEKSKRAKEICRKKNILVEAELGRIKGAEDRVQSLQTYYTKPEEAVEFVDRTDCDLLATSIGTQHGVSKGKNLDLKMDIASEVDKRLIEEGLERPLVIHGSSGLTRDQMKKLAGMGISKFNKDTRYQYEYARAAFEFYREHEGEILPPDGMDEEIDVFSTEGDWTPKKDVFDPRVVSKSIRERISKVLAELTEVTGSAERSLYI